MGKYSINVKRNCERKSCLKPFLTSQADIDKGWGRFCSKECNVLSVYKPPFERFWANIKAQGECWIWTASVDKDGYGKFYADKKYIRAHRWSYQHYNGPIPENMQILHTCDTPGCVNPKHLFAGTSDDNNKDASAKGRSRCGQHYQVESQISASNLSEFQKSEIKRKFKEDGLHISTIASEYKVYQRIIKEVLRS